MMILVVNVCREKLHCFEFVKTIEDILAGNDLKFFTRHYSEISDDDLEKCDKVIICGTSLADNEFIENSEKFSWIKNFDKPILGICAGMQIIGIIFGGKIVKDTEIGFFHEGFEKEFLGVKGEVEVYHLHNSCVEFSDDFEVYLSSRIAQAVKHKNKEIYGVLFHPEVRNKEMIARFANERKNN